MVVNELFGSFSWLQIATVSANNSFFIPIYGNGLFERNHLMPGSFKLMILSRKIYRDIK